MPSQGPETNADPKLDHRSSAPGPDGADDFSWLVESLGGHGRGPTRPHLVRPSLAEAQLVLPLTPRKATMACLHRSSDARPWRQRIAGRGAQLFARFGLLPVAGGEKIDLRPFRLVTHLAQQLGEPELVAGVSAGPRRRNRKPVLQLVRPDGTVVGFAKVAWSPLTRSLIANEARQLRSVAGRLPRGLAAPAVLWHDTWQLDAPGAPNEFEIVVTTPLRTPFLSHRSTPLEAHLLAGLARSCGGAHANVASTGLLDDYALRVGSVIDLSALRRHTADTDVEIGLWHGDLTPWNTATFRGVTEIWDWEFASEGRPVGFDLFHAAFEQVRRSDSGREAEALDVVEHVGRELLASVPDGPVTNDPEAVITLYFCELLDRELMLEGQGWEPGHLTPLREVLVERLRRRLGEA